MTNVVCGIFYWRRNHGLSVRYSHSTPGSCCRFFECVKAFFRPLIYAIRAYSYPGDKVVIQPPVYPPFSAIVRNNGRQLPIDPATGNFPGADIVSQTRQSLTNLKAILEANGMTMGNVVKTTVLLADINEFAAMNQVYGEFFTAPCFRQGAQSFATFSHLDAKTVQSVMAGLRQMGKTCIVITHDPRIIAECASVLDLSTKDAGI